MKGLLSTHKPNNIQSIKEFIENTNCAMSGFRQGLYGLQLRAPRIKRSSCEENEK